ncbi:MAG: hypothetical protein HY785_12315 [Oscillatoriophycideae cyanobacterium NC_groundwater_1537_Pr4_S-0.65um_50_18]|nr:hypothetical protein [Oscillatoriophycideae cyanobacterium NC_groundwater_1537_Pr4_S-0.65um_50_18]
MARSLPFKNSQPHRWQTVWRVIRPMLLLSVGVHALALLLPLPQTSHSEATAADQAITITQLPPIERSLKQPAMAQGSSAQPPVKAVSVRPVGTAVRTGAAASPPPAPVVRAAPVARPAPSPASPAPAAVPQGVAASPPAVVDAFPQDFPQYPEAQPGSFGLPTAYEPFSRKTSKAIAEVDEWFQQQLSRQNYTIEPVEQSSQRLVYRVAKGGVTEFLTLIPNAAGGTNILVIPDPLLQSNDQALLPNGDSKFVADLAEILPTATSSGWQAVSNPAALVAEPTAFFDSAPDSTTDGTTEVSPTLKAIAQSAVYAEKQGVDAVFDDLRPKFQAAEIDLIRVGDYGGGGLYQAIRSGTSRFFSLIPAQEGQSTLLVLWRQSPI